MTASGATLAHEFTEDDRAALVLALKPEEA